MNPYFVFFALYSVLIAPVSVRFSLRFDKSVSFGLRFQCMGVPLARRRQPQDRTGERKVRHRDVAKSLGSTDYALVKAVVKTALGPRFRHTVRLVELSLYARFAFEDARRTAMWYAATREALRTLSVCLRTDCRIDGRVEADFAGGGTEALIRGIIGARLGSLAYVAILLLSRYARDRAELQTAKEDEHAASH